MEKLPKNERILVVATSILLISILLMVITIPLVFYDTSPNSTPQTAATAISVAIVIHLIIFIGYIKVIRENKRIDKNRNGEYIGIGVLLFFFGVIYMDGAFAFLDNSSTFWVSVLMFTCTLCDCISSIMTIVAYFLKPH